MSLENSAPSLRTRFAHSSVLYTGVTIVVLVFVCTNRQNMLSRSYVWAMFKQLSAPEIAGNVLDKPIQIRGFV